MPLVKTRMGGPTKGGNPSPGKDKNGLILNPSREQAAQYNIPYTITFKGKRQVLSSINPELPGASSYVDIEYPAMKKVKRAPAYDSKKRQVSSRKFY